MMTYSYVNKMFAFNPCRMGHDRIVVDGVALVNPFTVSDGVVSYVSSRLKAAETEKIRHHRSIYVPHLGIAQPPLQIQA